MMGSESELGTFPESPHMYKLSKETRGVGITLATTIARCLDPLTVPDAVLLLSSAWSYLEEAEGDVP